MERFERQKQILELLQEPLTVKELTKILRFTDREITINLIDFHCRHNNQNGYLKRSKNIFGIYTYEISKNGVKQLTWLKNGEHYNYLYEYM